MGLAGSTGRSAAPAEDAALGRQLLRSAKDRYEHDVVVQSMTRRLEPLVTALEFSPEPALYRLPNIQHLFTPIHATLRKATGVLPLVAALHPTPALGGAPREAAMAFIQQAEPVPRGWYAAPIGWIDHRLDGVFGVAIRSAVSQYERIWLYAGAGIVAESVASREWAETALKFTPMLHAFDVQAKPPELP
jgi:menaquinone-specific isochorismate synthase